MTQALQTWSEQTVQVLGGGVRVLKGGKGDPLVVLHRDTGFPERQPFLDEMAERFTVYHPIHPGYHQTEAKSWSWPLHIRDLAVIELQLFKALGLDSFTVVGLGFGGWLAAEMATMCERLFRRMVLVAPMGLQPKKGEIFDQFLVNSETYARTGFHDPRNFEAAYGAEPPYERLDLWETQREMTCRIAWKPNMFNQTLPLLLPGVGTPALVVWGREDRIVPLECGELYVQALKSARLEVIEGCGHAVDLEQPHRLARLVTEFARAR